MNIKQIYKMYDNQRRSHTIGWKYCPACGTKYSNITNIKEFNKVCSDCGFVYHKSALPGVSVLVLDNNDNFILCKRGLSSYQAGKWCLPCGYIEFNEDFLAASIREVKEETGLNVKIESIIGVVSNFFTPEVHTLVIVLLAHPESGTLSPQDDETDAVQWFSIDKGLPAMAFEADIHIIDRYFRTGLVGIPIDSDYR